MIIFKSSYFQMKIGIQYFEFIILRDQRTNNSLILKWLERLQKTDTDQEDFVEELHHVLRREAGFIILAKEKV